jgi:hypothetical protein
MQCYKMNEKYGTMGSWNITSHATKLILNEDLAVKLTPFKRLLTFI